MKLLGYLIVGLIAFFAFQLFFTPTIDSATPTKTPPVGGWLTDYAAALDAARSQNKPILINFTGSDWCGWCVRLKEEVFSQSEFIDFARQRLVLLELDFPRSKPQPPALVEQNRQLQKRFHVRGFPTLILLAPGGTKQAQLGYMPGGPGVFIGELQKHLR